MNDTDNTIMIGIRRPVPSVRGGLPHLQEVRPERRGHWVFSDVVFQDAGFQTTRFKPLTHISFRCEVPTPSVVEGQ